jgi:hypothetical protein
MRRLLHQKRKPLFADWNDRAGAFRTRRRTAAFVLYQSHFTKNLTRLERFDDASADQNLDFTFLDNIQDIAGMPLLKNQLSSLIKSSKETACL